MQRVIDMGYRKKTDRCQTCVTGEEDMRIKRDLRQEEQLAVRST